MNQYYKSIIKINIFWNKRIIFCRHCSILFNFFQFPTNVITQMGTLVTSTMSLTTMLIGQNKTVCLLTIIVKLLTYLALRTYFHIDYSYELYYAVCPIFRTLRQDIKLILLMYSLFLVSIFNAKYMLFRLLCYSRH